MIIRIDAKEMLVPLQAMKVARSPTTNGDLNPGPFTSTLCEAKIIPLDHLLWEMLARNPMECSHNTDPLLNYDLKLKYIMFKNSAT